MSDHHQHGSMMVRPPRRDAAHRDAASAASAGASAAAQARAVVAAPAQAPARAAGLFGRFFQRRHKPD